jgi:natural product precursor
MKKLKSLKEFGSELNSLNSQELRQVTGGKIKTWYVPGTCKNGCTDHTIMNQEVRWDGDSYEPYGPPYTTGVLVGSNDCP